jgi:hypothetical protein
MYRALVSLAVATISLLLNACSSTPKAAYEQENFTQNHTFTRSFAADYKVACDAGRRALLSQGYNIDKYAGDAISGHKNFIDEEGHNTQITFNINCAPDGLSPEHSQVFANAVQDGYSLKKSSTAASVGVGPLGSVSLPFTSGDDSLVKTSSLTVTRPQFYGGFFDLLQQYLAVARIEPPEPKPAAPKLAAPATPTPAAEPQPPVTPTVPLTPENTGIAKQPDIVPESASPAAPAADKPAEKPAEPASASASTPASTPASSQAPTSAKPADSPADSQ